MTAPEHIDLEAIALIQGVSVKYRPLDGCEARILGNNQSAVVTINSSSKPERRRFSLAHELGHWKYHRGQLLMCHSKDIGGVGGVRQSERVANDFAADLLMPGYLFDPRAGTLPFGFGSIDKLAGEFAVSRMATAIRFVRRSKLPMILANYTNEGRGWFFSSRSVEGIVWPSKQIHCDSPAFAWLFGKGTPQNSPRKAPAHHWLDGWQAKKFDLQFQATNHRNGMLAMLALDQRMLAEY